jgi:hypothetical protein
MSKRIVTKEMLDAAHAHHVEYGFDLKTHTPHKVARELMSYDRAFSDVDYTQLVSAVTHWQKGLGW